MCGCPINPVGAPQVGRAVMVTMIVPPRLSTRGTQDHVAAIQRRFKGGRANFGGCLRAELILRAPGLVLSPSDFLGGRTDPAKEIWNAEPEFHSALRNGEDRATYSSDRLIRSNEFV